MWKTMYLFTLWCLWLTVEWFGWHHRGIHCADGSSIQPSPFIDTITHITMMQQGIFTSWIINNVQDEIQKLDLLPHGDTMTPDHVKRHCMINFNPIIFDSRSKLSVLKVVWYWFHQGSSHAWKEFWLDTISWMLSAQLDENLTQHLGFGAEKGKCAIDHLHKVLGMPQKTFVLANLIR